jgi:PKD repeat protein
MHAESFSNQRNIWVKHLRLSTFKQLIFIKERTTPLNYLFLTSKLIKLLFMIQPIHERRLNVFLFLMLGLLLPLASMAQVNFSMTGYTPNGCRPQNITFTASATGANSYKWDFNDGTPVQTTASTTIIHNFTHGGNQQVRLSAFNGATNLGGTQQSVYIGGINGNLQSTLDSACVGEQVSFYIYGNINNYQWNFGDPGSGPNNTSTQSQPSHTFNSAGIYTVQIKSNTNPCGMDSVTKIIVVNNSVKPNTNFFFNRTNCPGDPVNFNAADWHATNLSWNFGDPGSGTSNTSTSQNPIHAYASIGKYYVTLTSTNPCGQTASRIDSVQIQSGLKWGPNNFMANIYYGQASTFFKGCPGDIFDFYTQATAASYTWNFGDGTPTATNKASSHVYANNGTYTLTLDLKNGCGNDTIITRTVTIGSTNFGGNPSISSSSNSICPKDKIFFDANPKSKAYLWTFGDSTSSTLSKPSHSYTSIGTKTITLKLTSNCGIDTTITKNVTITNSIVPVLMYSGGGGGNWGLTVNTGCPGDLISLYTYGGSSYSIDFGDGYITTQTTPLVTGNGTYDIASHAYSILGTFKVKLTYFNACGNSAKDSVNVTIGNAQPVTNGGINITSNGPFMSCQPIQLLGSGGKKYAWNFGNGDTLTTSAAIIQYAYPVAGNFIISLVVTNSCGNSATFTKNISINNIPNPIITKSGDTLITSPATTYQWKLNGTNIGGATNAKYIASISGNYTIAITDANGCAASSSFQNCFVKAGPNVGICPGQSAQLNASGATSYSWSPSAGLSNAAIANPTASPAANQTYVVTGTTAGCPAVKDSLIVSKITSLVANAGTNKTICSGTSIALNGSGGGTYSWSPSTALSSTTVANPTASPTSNQTYTLTVTSGTCTSNASVTITVNNAPTVATGSNKTICADVASIAITGTSTNATGVTWSSTGTGTFAPNATTANATYTPSSSDKVNSPVTLTLTTNGSGVCSAVSNQMAVTITPVPTVNAGINQTVCANNALTTLVGTKNAVVTAVQWSKTGSGVFSAPTSLNTTYTPSAADITAGTVTLTLSSTAQGTCNAVASSMILTITPAPTASAGAAQTVCTNNAVVSLNGTVTVATGGVWTSSGTGTFGNTASLATTYTPSAADKTAGTVTLTLTTTGNGTCNAVSSSKTITITAAPSASAGAAQTVCANNAVVSLNGTVTVATGGVWTSSGTGTFGNTASLATTYTPSAADKTAGTVTLTLTTTGNGTCNAVSSPITVTITPAPAVSAGSNSTVCANANASLNGTVTSATSGIWSGGTGTFSPSNTTLTATYTPSASEIAAGTMVLTLTSTGNGNCTAVTNQMTLNITPLASIANAGADQNVCTSTATLNATTPAIGTGTWTVFSGPASITNTGSPASGVTALSGASKLVWTVSNTCSSTSDTVVVTQTANAVATVTITSDAVNNHICQGTGVTFTGFAVNGGTPTYQWKLNSSPVAGATNSTYSNSALANTNQVSLVMTSTLGCATGSPATSNIITMTVDPTASIANAGPDQNITVSNATLAANSATSGTGAWTVAMGAAVFANSALATTTVSGLSVGINKLVWTISSGLCSASSDTVVITVTTPTGITNNVIQISSNNVYPNPFTEEVNIKFSNVPSNVVIIKVTDLAGKVVKTFEHDTANDLKLGNDLNTGMYCVQIIYGDHVEVTRIVKMQ